MSGVEAPADAGEIWDQSRLGDPHAADDKASRVRAMFSAIAGSYDLNNRVHSLGRDQHWRSLTVRQVAPKPTDRVLDVACGTGDLALMFAPLVEPPVLGLDFTLPMLPLAQAKAAAAKQTTWEAGPGITPRPATDIVWINGDAAALPLADACVDIVTIAFGLRNLADPAAGVTEMVRVLRPGGRLAVLEFSEPRNPLMRWSSNLYTRHVMPRTATLISGDRTGAYRYLPRSVATFLDPAGIRGLMADAGLTRVRSSTLTMGIATLTVGEVPAADVAGERPGAG